MAWPSLIRIASVGQRLRHIVHPVHLETSKETECSYVFIGDCNSFVENFGKLRKVDCHQNFGSLAEG